jgi:hypothetical protein
MEETKGVCGRCKDGKGTKKVIFKCETCTSFTCASCEGGDTAGVRIKAKKLGRFDCLLCKGVKGEDITLITLSKKLEALEKNMTTKAEMEDILKQLAVVKQENVDLRRENQVLKKELEDNKNITKSYGAMAAKNVSNMQKGNVTYKEVEERSDRRLNIIVRGIRESAKGDGLERKEDDRKLAISVCVSTGAVEHNEMSESILEIRRLGKYDEEKLYRPLLVKIGRGDLREKLVRTGKKLRELNETNKTRYRIEADLTKEQTNSYQAMWKEADAQSGNGKKFYVTGPRENPILRSRDLTEEEALATRDLEGGVAAEGGGEKS